LGGGFGDFGDGLNFSSPPFFCILGDFRFWVKKWSKMVKNGQKMVKNGQKMAKKGSKMGGIFNRCLGWEAEIRNFGENRQKW